MLDARNRGDICRHHRRLPAHQCRPGPAARRPIRRARRCKEPTYPELLAPGALLPRRPGHRSRGALLCRSRSLPPPLLTSQSSGCSRLPPVKDLAGHSRVDGHSPTYYDLLEQDGDLPARHLPLQGAVAWTWPLFARKRLTNSFSPPTFVMGQGGENFTYTPSKPTSLQTHAVVFSLIWRHPATESVRVCPASSSRRPMTAQEWQTIGLTPQCLLPGPFASRTFTGHQIIPARGPKQCVCV